VNTRAIGAAIVVAMPCAFPEFSSVVTAFSP
jgi:hypothetical protein